MSETKLSERMAASIRLAIHDGHAITLSEAEDWREEIVTFEANLEAAALDLELADREIADLKAKLKAMERALYDVAKGMVPNDFSLEGDPREVRSRLFTWSQERAREGLAAAQEKEE